MVGPAYTTRPAQPEDIPGCAAVFAEARAAAYPAEPPDSRSLAAYRASCVGEEQWVCCMGEKVIAVISVYWDDNFIHSLYVSPAFWRCGCGRALLDVVRGRATGPLELKVDAANAAACAFYRHLGWREVGAGVGAGGRWLRLRLDGVAGPSGT